VSTDLSPARELFSHRSDAQEVLLEQEADGSLSLTIDGHWQFSSRDEAIFHELLADLPMVLAPRIERVLILGGGDALALRNVLRYEGVRQVDLVDIDEAVMQMVREVPQMRELSESALEDPRVRVHVADAWDYVHRAARRSYDLVICDFPACTDPKLERLFDAPFHRRLAELMDDAGVVSVQVSLDPPGFWDFVEGALEPSYAQLWPSLVALGDPASVDTEWADFVVASHQPLRARRALAPGASVVLRDDLLEAQRIQNRARSHFETQAYGEAPDFSEPW
jgi:spermidine synthase